MDTETLVAIILGVAILIAVAALFWMMRRIQRRLPAAPAAPGQPARPGQPPAEPAQPPEDPLTVRLRIVNDRARQAATRLTIATVELWTIRDERRANAQEDRVLEIMLQDSSLAGQARRREGPDPAPRVEAQADRPENQQDPRQ